MRRAYERIEGRSRLISSPYGDIEYLEGGSGPAVLVVHWSGGGYDQGELIVRAVLGDGVHWIAPSRFGYLRSTFHDGATFDDQAHAYAHLLDRLHIQRAAVVALSHGGPSALLFAVLHPERVTSLTLISAGVASSIFAVSDHGIVLSVRGADIPPHRLKGFALVEHEVVEGRDGGVSRLQPLEHLCALESMVYGRSKPLSRGIVSDLPMSRNHLRSRSHASSRYAASEARSCGF
jgi:pimeloyl-ACP methyl ester carboxylesterase